MGNRYMYLTSLPSPPNQPGPRLSEIDLVCACRIHTCRSPALSLSLYIHMPTQPHSLYPFTSMLTGPNCINPHLTSVCVVFHLQRFRPQVWPKTNDYHSLTFYQSNVNFLVHVLICICCSLPPSLPPSDLGYVPDVLERTQIQVGACAVIQVARVDVLRNVCKSARRPRDAPIYSSF